MSTAANLPFPPPAPLTAAPPDGDSLSDKLGSVGLGYSIAISLGFLVFISTVFLSTYMCYRSAADRRRRRRFLSGAEFHDPSAPTERSVYVPRIIFVAEDDNDDVSDIVGLDPAVINSYPKFQFAKRVGTETTCAICLCEYRDSEMLRVLPDCRHFFHVNCVDVWLKMNASCPVCRNSPLPTPRSTPLATPLQEVVPLSQWTDGRRGL